LLIFNNMAKFDEAIKKILEHEGGYVNNKNDKGGETYMGISRKAHPNSKIWAIIDVITKKYKTVKTINKYLRANVELTNLIKDIYKKEYWNPLSLDKEKSQRLANQIFDNAVNMGVSKTKKMLERVRNEMASV